MDANTPIASSMSVRVEADGGIVITLEDEHGKTLALAIMAPDVAMDFGEAWISHVDKAVAIVAMHETKGTA